LVPFRSVAGVKLSHSLAAETGGAGDDREGDAFVVRDPNPLAQLFPRGIDRSLLRRFDSTHLFRGRCHVIKKRHARLFALRFRHTF
jgi:hypothetical protein